MLLVLCGCSERGSVTPILKGISFNAEISLAEAELSCTAEIFADGGMTVCLTDPAELSGMTLLLDGTGVTAEYMGITYSAPQGEFSQGNAIRLMWDALADAADRSAVAHQGENCSLNGAFKDREYTLYCAPCGLPLSLEMPAEGFKVIFGNVKIKE